MKQQKRSRSPSFGSEGEKHHDNDASAKAEDLLHGVPRQGKEKRRTGMTFIPASPSYFFLIFPGSSRQLL